MSRTCSIAGLNSRAKKMVQGNKILKYYKWEGRRYPHGRIETLPDEPVYKSDVKTEIYKEEDVWYGQIHHLFKFIFPDGRVLYEEVQASPWDSGPTYFMALKDENGEWVKESLWTDDEINGYMGYSRYDEEC